jgi:hypothetical protein
VEESFITMRGYSLGYVTPRGAVTGADDCQREIAVAYDLQRDRREIEKRIEITTSLVVRHITAALRIRS